MKKSVLLLTQFVVSLSLILLLSDCNPDVDPCTTCVADYAEEKKVSEIIHYDEDENLTARFQFYYSNSLLDSIVKTDYGDVTARKTSSDSIVSVLHVFYGYRSCIPSFYELRTYETGEPVTLETGFMATSGDMIISKHLAYYDDADLPVTTGTAQIDYLYAAGDVINRSGTDYGILIWPGPYGNTNSYTYTGANVTHIDTWKEQAGYDLDIAFDSRSNPFNIQDGVMYYLNSIAYNDVEFFESIALDANNPTEIVYQGTDTSNGFVTRTFTFTHVYTGDGYPQSVAIYEVEDNDVYGDSETDHGTYTFTYY